MLFDLPRRQGSYFTSSFLQRPSAVELLRHPFIKRAKRNNHLMDMIDRYKNWMTNHGNETDSDSDSQGDTTNNSDDSDWNMTVKGSVSPYIEEQQAGEDSNKLLHSMQSGDTSQQQLINGSGAGGADSSAPSSLNETSPSESSQAVKVMSASMSQLDVTASTPEPSNSVSSKNALSTSPSKHQQNNGSTTNITRSDMNIVSVPSSIMCAMIIMNLLFCSPARWKRVQALGPWSTWTDPPPNRTPVHHVSPRRRNDPVAATGHLTAAERRTTATSSWWRRRRPKTPRDVAAPRSRARPTRTTPGRRSTGGRSKLPLLRVSHRLGARQTTITMVLPVSM